MSRVGEVIDKQRNITEYPKEFVPFVLCIMHVVLCYVAYMYRIARMRFVQFISCIMHIVLHVCKGLPVRLGGHCAPRTDCVPSWILKIAVSLGPSVEESLVRVQGVP